MCVTTRNEIEATHIRSLGFGDIRGGVTLHRLGCITSGCWELSWIQVSLHSFFNMSLFKGPQTQELNVG